MAQSAAGVYFQQGALALGTAQRIYRSGMGSILRSGSYSPAKYCCRNRSHAQPGKRPHSPDDLLDFHSRLPARGLAFAVVAGKSRFHCLRTGIRLFPHSCKTIHTPNIERGKWSRFSTARHTIPFHRMRIFTGLPHLMFRRCCGSVRIVCTTEPADFPAPPL